MKNLSSSASGPWWIYATRDQLYAIRGQDREAPWSWDYEYGPFPTREEAEDYRRRLVHTSHACSSCCVYAGFCADDPVKCK